MTECDLGHSYLLHVLDMPSHAHSPKMLLMFVKREGPKYPGNTGSYPGTILQECWRAEIARLKYLNNQEWHEVNDEAIEALRNCIYATGWRDERPKDMAFNLLLPSISTHFPLKIYLSVRYVGISSIPRRSIMILFLNAMKFIGGAGIGMLLVYLLIWLVFVYPYSEVKLGFLWTGLVFGVLVGVVANIAFGFYMGPMD